MKPKSSVPQVHTVPSSSTRTSSLEGWSRMCEKPNTLSQDITGRVTLQKYIRKKRGFHHVEEGIQREQQQRASPRTTFSMLLQPWPRVTQSKTLPPPPDSRYQMTMCNLSHNRTIRWTSTDSHFLLQPFGHSQLKRESGGWGGGEVFLIKWNIF